VNTRKLFHISSYLAALPVATLIAAFDRYGDGVVIPQFAWPMVSALGASYLLPTLLLFSRKPRAQEDRIWRPLVTLMTSYLLAFSVLTGFRFYFSIGFTVTFIIITVLWTLWIDRYHVDEISSNKFAIAKVGDWQLIHESSTDSTLLEDPSLLDMESFDGLVIDYHASLPDNWKSAIAQFALSPRPVFHISQFFEMAHERVAIGHLDDDHNILGLSNSFYSLLKRGMDICLSATLSILLSLPLIIILFLVKITSKGPSIYRQQRIGRNNKPFSLYKIRTMINSAEHEGVKFTTFNDSRITKIGKYLRLLRIDEWPQFWNVLKGDMSIIGPRPERPEWVNQFNQKIPYYNLRHAVRPGITGWAQVKQGYATGLDESITKLEYDLYYIKHIGPYLDFRIAIHTLRVVFLQFGAK